MELPIKAPIVMLAEADFVLEFFTNRSGYVEHIEALLEMRQQSDQFQIFITDQCLDKVRFYLGRQEASLGEAAVSLLESLFEDCIISISQQQINKARHSHLRDFESAVEVMCAIDHNLTAIVTHHPGNFVQAGFPIWQADRWKEEFHQFLVQPILVQMLMELQAEIPHLKGNPTAVVSRIVAGVERAYRQSEQIQASDQLQLQKTSLARHQLQRCLDYYRLGLERGRVELQSTLGAIVYRYIAPLQMQVGSLTRSYLTKDFLQGFYVESLKVFRQENDVSDKYQPRTPLEWAEYMAFTEQYAKRRIILKSGQTQQLIVLQAHRFSQRQPIEETVDVERALESAIREHIVMDAVDSSESVLRDHFISKLIQYLKTKGQDDCIDYLLLKLQGLSAPEIDEILQLTPRKRDYLQQRFKYHVEKFARPHNWNLVQQWLEADLEQNLGLSAEQWEIFVTQLTSDQLLILKSKQLKLSDREIADWLKSTVEQVREQWIYILDLARQTRDDEVA